MSVKTAHKLKLYTSGFQASPTANRVLRAGRIIDNNEAPSQMIERVVDTLFSLEKNFGTHYSETKKAAEAFGQLLDEKSAVMSTPVMTNAGRHQDRPLAACTVPAVDLKNNLSKVKKIVERYHEEAIGTGFNLDDLEDPVSVLKYLNQIAVNGAKSGREERPVGNMAILNAHHPKILEFIHAKTNSDELGVEWKFNISVDASLEFMTAAEEKKDYLLWDGTRLPANEVLSKITASAHKCGDPGLAFIDRMNEHNPTPGLGRYTSTAPCGEVGLAPGETCQFGYINLSNFVRDNRIDYTKLASAVRLMTRALDNALEYSIQRFSQDENRHVMSAKRKIGVGICGLAEMLIKLRLPYGSSDARQEAANVVSFINYESKLASMELAQTRGSFLAMNWDTGCLYHEAPGYLSRFAAHPSEKVSVTAWQELEKTIRTHRKLRNASTLALPPTGRSGLVIDATPGVEPLFQVLGYDGEIHPLLETYISGHPMRDKLAIEIKKTGRIGHLDQIALNIRELFRTALEIPAEEHLLMVAELQKHVDESISKTINLPQEATPADISNLYLKAYKLNLKGITIYRTGSRMVQPRSLAKL